MGIIFKRMRGDEGLVQLIHLGNNDAGFTWGKGDSVNGEVDR